MFSLYEWKFVSEENVANIPLKICAFITFDTIENVSQDKKSFCNMFLYDMVSSLYVNYVR